VNAVVITTRHDSHARFVLMALERGKHVFVEKPLALTLDELAAIRDAYEDGVGKGLPTYEAGHAGRPAVDGWVQSPFCATGTEDERPARGCLRVQVVCDDGECGRHSADALDAGSGSGRRAHRG
jgi:hypothetical protein